MTEQQGPPGTVGPGPDVTEFRLAPMNGLILALTVLVLAIPAILLARGLSVVALLVVLMCAWVWFWMRPRCFLVDAESMWVIWPWRRVCIPRSRIESVRGLTSAEFRKQHGLAMRIGVGGLWGGFGLLWTRPATYSMYVSRTDGLVIVERKGERALLITPASPEEFVASLSS